MQIEPETNQIICEEMEMDGIFSDHKESHMDKRGSKHVLLSSDRWKPENILELKHDSPETDPLLAHI